MTTSVNGIGTTIAPMPKQGEERLSVIWCIFGHMPLYPLAWVMVRGEGSSVYTLFSKSNRAEAIGLYGGDVVRQATWESFRALSGRFLLMMGILVVIYAIFK